MDCLRSLGSFSHWKGLRTSWKNSSGQPFRRTDPSMWWRNRLNDFWRVLLTQRYLEMGVCEILILTTLFKTVKVKDKAQCICAEGAAWSDDEL